MIPRVIHCIILFFLLSFLAYAQLQRTQDDTLTFTLDEHIVVTASRLPVELSHAPVAVDVFHASEINLLPVSSLSDVLSLTAGTNIRSYGGTGSLQLASVRGVGAEYTLVYVDGIRINDSQNATVDLGRLSLYGIERIEVARGGFAALYGSNALGGVVSIHSRRDSPPTTLQLALGSYGLKTASLMTGISGRIGRAFIAAAYDEADNDFPVTPSWGGPVVQRKNAAMLRKSIKAGGTLLLPSAILSIQADAFQNYIGVPGPMFSAHQGRASQEDDQILLSAQLAAQLGNGTMTLNVGGRTATQHYSDPAVTMNGIPLDSRYNNTHLSMAVIWETPLLSTMRTSLGIEANMEYLQSAELQNHPRRKQIAVFASGEWKLLPAGLPFHLYPSLRFDALCDTPFEREWKSLSPSLGIHLQLLSDRLALRFRSASNFSVPTFNQLYWKEGGNISLRPEQSFTVDGGVHIQHNSVLKNLDITYFHHGITDKIVWMPGQGMWCSPRNIQHVVSNGIESTVELALLYNVLTLRMTGQWITAIKQNASFQGDATQGKQLLYIPRLSATLALLMQLSPDFRLSVVQHAYDRRYYTENNDASLPAYTVFDVSAQLRVPLQLVELTLKADLLNAFNTEYQVIAFYPMPGRNIRMSLISSF